VADFKDLQRRLELTFNQEVAGSIPAALTNEVNMLWRKAQSKCQGL